MTKSASVSVDKLFNQLERQTERDLYNKSRTAATNSRRKMFDQVQGTFSAERRKSMGVGLLWFFASILIGFVLGYIFFELIVLWFPTLHHVLGDRWLGSDLNLLYFLSLLCFIGVYVTRITLWVIRSM